jgi:hypothetical protein
LQAGAEGVDGGLNNGEPLAVVIAFELERWLQPGAGENQRIAVRDRVVVAMAENRNSRGILVAEREQVLVRSLASRN